MEYGYARISTAKQNIERQIRNIQLSYPNAHIVKEIFTGTKIQSRKELDKLLKLVKEGDKTVKEISAKACRNIGCKGYFGRKSKYG